MTRTTHSRSWTRPELSPSTTTASARCSSTPSRRRWRRRSRSWACPRGWSCRVSSRCRRGGWRRCCPAGGRCRRRRRCCGRCGRTTAPGRRPACRPTARTPSPPSTPMYCTDLRRRRTGGGGDSIAVLGCSHSSIVADTTCPSLWSGVLGVRLPALGPPTHGGMEGGAVRDQRIVTKYQGRLGRGTGSRVEGRHLKKVWYEGGIPLWNDDPKIGT